MGTKITSGPQGRRTKSEVAASFFFFSAQNRGKNATSPLHSRGSPTKGNKIRSGCLNLPSRGPKIGRKCYVTLAFSGIPNKGEQNHNWLPHPCLLRHTKEGRNAMSALHSRGSSPKGKKIRSGWPTPAFLGAQKRAEVLHHPCVLGGPLRKRTKTKVAHKMAKVLHPPCVLGGPQTRG